MIIQNKKNGINYDIPAQNWDNMTIYEQKKYRVIDNSDKLNVIESKGKAKEKDIPKEVKSFNASKDQDVKKESTNKE